MSTMTLKNRIESFGPEDNVSFGELRSPSPHSVNAQFREDRHTVLLESFQRACQDLQELEPGDPVWAQRNLTFSIMMNILQSAREGDRESIQYALEALGRNCNSISK